VCVCVIVDTVIVPTVILCVGAGATSESITESCCPHVLCRPSDYGFQLKIMLDSVYLRWL